jgi:translation initiation factor 5B
MGKKNNEKSDCPSIRSPICATLGHVDHGKSTILDAIRGSSIVNTEAGKITQTIGASIIPIDVISKICGKLLDIKKFTLPGILFIDTPGHAAFTSLRKRGGNLADIAILVVDINEGFKPQTIEALEILKKSKTPFVVVANKLDLVSGYREKNQGLLQDINSQHPEVSSSIDYKLYELVGKLSEYGINSERYDRVADFTSQIAIIPVSGITKKGIPELLMVITGLAQKFLEKCLSCNVHGNGKGVILEVKEERGLGKTIDVILYDGSLHVNDIIVVGGVDQPIITKIKALLEPQPLQEMRDKKTKFKSIRCVSAASGIKIAAPDFDKVISGMPIMSCKKEELDEVCTKIQEEIDEVFIETDGKGIVIKADNIGSLEAMILLLREKEIPIKRATIGNISKKDILEASTNLEKHPEFGVILGFNIHPEEDSKNVKIITEQVIYTLIEKFEVWQKEQKEREELRNLAKLTRPYKIRLIEGFVFRQSSPAIVGVDVLEGTITSNTRIMNHEGKDISKVKGLQLEQKKVEKAEKNKQVAVSFENVTVGRQINVNDILYSGISEIEFKELKKYKKHLHAEEIELLKEISTIKRKSNPVWGI